MSIFQEFLESSLKQKIKNLIPLTGGASAEINRIILTNNKELIVRRSVIKDEAVMAIPKLLEAKIQKIVKSFGAPVPEIIMEFSEADEIGEGYIMEAVSGETIPRKILKNDNYEYIRDKLPIRNWKIFSTNPSN